MKIVKPQIKLPADTATKGDPWGDPWGDINICN